MLFRLALSEPRRASSTRRRTGRRSNSWAPMLAWVGSTSGNSPMFRITCLSLPVLWLLLALTPSTSSGALYRKTDGTSAQLLCANTVHPGCSSAGLPHPYSSPVVLEPGDDLSSASLISGDFSEADFEGSILQSTDFSSANLTDASFRNAGLFEAIMDNAVLTRAVLSGANLAGVRFGLGNDLTAIEAVGLVACPETLPSTIDCINNNLVGPGLVLRNTNFDGVNFTGRNLFQTVLTNASLIGTTLTSANLDQADLRNADLTGADLTNVSMVGATVHSLNFQGTTLSAPRVFGLNGCPINLPANWECREAPSSYGTLLGPGADLSNESGFLSGGNFSATTLTSADLSNSVFTLVDFSNATLTSANLSNSVFDSAIFAGAVLSAANLAGADLGSASLSGVNGVGVAACPATLPADWACIANNLFGPGAVLSGANLSGQDLSGMNLQNVDLASADLSGVRGVGLTACPGTLPAAWACVNLNLVGPGADLSEADLADADLSGQDLSGANLSNADLSNAVLANAILDLTNLEQAIAVGADFTNVDLTTASLSWGRFYDLVGAPIALPPDFAQITQPNSGATALIGLSADLESADLSGGIDLSGYDLSFANLAYINLRDAILVGTDFAASILDHGDFTDADFSGANIQSADLFYATLAGANFGGADLSGAILRYADISGANFLGADLTNAWVVNLVATTPPTLESYDALVATGSGYVIAGPQLLLYDADLTGADLSGLNLNGSEFIDAILHNANFSGTDLRGTWPLPSYLPGSTSSPFYSASTQFSGFDPVSSGWRLLTAAAVPAMGPLGLGILATLLTLVGFRIRRRH